MALSVPLAWLPVGMKSCLVINSTETAASLAFLVLL
uniref:Uncharacterized protein n=1 Tax=Rhizophora mucronata TaxID=61149 RepID=A0A2P2Q6U3_RHIMU